ncbi:MAG TPA: helix-turn-helix transcriptional regulator [Terriglobales bacterium]|nr:helix-turn-helix transcriptional regulator [Terriglobales bacterium]
MQTARPPRIAFSARAVTIVFYGTRRTAEEGSLYPSPHRMEADGRISATWGLTENKRRARYYRLTAAGRRELERHTRSWRQATGAVAAARET